MLIQASILYVHNNQSEGIPMVESFSDLILSLQLLLLSNYEVRYSSTVKLRNEKEVSVTSEIFIVIKYQTKINHGTTSPLVEYKKKH
mmetsp:Transcript_35416/g.40674  ORF Transcript_35416/g.40674 Transcript_35416/m.40674 type:complete len:87 (-) Transcript_35416:419-679(-)